VRPPDSQVFNDSCVQNDTRGASEPLLSIILQITDFAGDKIFYDDNCKIIPSLSSYNNFLG